MIRTVLFTDIVGSTRLRTTHGDATVDGLVEVHDQIVQRAVESAAGTLVKGTGDGSLAVFESAVSAVQAGIEIQQSVRAWRESPTVAGDLEVRVGINAGEVSETDRDVLGEAVNAAARVLDHASGDEILVTRVVRDLIGTSAVAFVDRGEKAMRGFADPWQLFEVDWEQAGKPRVLVVRLLGEASVEIGGTRLPGALAPGLQRLLAQLALAGGRPVARSTLAFTLWPDSDEPQARTNLRKMLHLLRRDLPNVPDYVEIDQQQLRLRVEGPGTTDIFLFEAAIEHGDDRAAIDAYGGDLLPECYDDWVLVERDRLRESARRALGRLTSAASERGDDRAVIDHAEALLVIDPVWEEAYRSLMRAHVRMGNRAEALRTYHRCTQVVARELGVEPDPETRATYEGLRINAIASTSSVTARVATALIGREDELGQLRHCWELAAGGGAHLVLVTGEPGVGKSRLLQEFARDVAAVATLAHARSYEGAGRLPWGPVIEWLRTPKVARRFSSMAPAWRSELATLLPELVDEAPADQGSGVGLDPGRRRQLFDAVTRALLPDPGPVILVIDDLQWCDSDTLDLIGFLLASVRDAPLLVAGTAREAELDEGHPVRAMLNGLQRIDAVTTIPLTRLAREATADLVRSLTDADLSVDHLERIWQETDGNPLFVVETARAGLDADRPGTTSPTVKATISARLGRLSAPARSVVEVAATLGREFTAEVLVAAMDERDEVVIESLDELWRHQIIREQGSSYDFHHDKIREVVADGLSPIRRRRLHGTVADALVAIFGDEPGPHQTQVAVHLEDAGRVREAAAARQGAARHALDVFAMEEADRECRRGLALLAQLPAGQERDQQELALRLLLAPTVVAQEGYGSALGQEAFERCTALCRRLGRSPDPATLRGLGLAAVVSCRFDRSAIHGEALIAMADDPIAVTEGHYLLGVTAFWRGDVSGSLHHLQAAIDSYRPERSASHRTYFSQDPYGVCLARLGVSLIWSGEIEAGWRALDEAYEFATSIGHPTTLGYVLLYGCFAASEVGDLERFRADLEEGVRLWKRETQHMATFILLGRCFEPWLRILQGDRAAIDDLRLASAGLDHESARLHLTFGLGAVARACLLVGDLDEGLRATREAIAWGRSNDQRYLEPLLRRVEGEFLAASGDDAGAVDAISAASALARSQGAGLLEVQAETALHALQTGDRGPQR